MTNWFCYTLLYSDVDVNCSQEFNIVIVLSFILLVASSVTLIYGTYCPLFLFVALLMHTVHEQRHTLTHTQNGGYCLYFVQETKQKKTQHTRHPSQDDLSNKRRTRGHPTQQHPGEQDVITKLLTVLSHWAPLCATVGNLFTLVRITSQVRQPVNPSNETWFESTSGTFRKTQTPLGRSMHGQLMPKCAACCCATVCVSDTNSHQLLNTYSELLLWNIPHKSRG